jgi:3-deoxy-D-manno-octulosonic-acid transferase
VRTAYTAMLRMALPFILLRLWWRGRREPRYREAVAERFGRYRAPAKDGLVWIHAVSVGEARAAAPLVKALADHPILITCTTAAGRETLEQVYGDSITAAYLPYDYPEAVERFLRHFRPRLAVLMETEVWPNLLRACKGSGIPVVLANARMSARSARGYARWSRLTRPAFASLSAACAQSAADGERLRALGAANVEVTGNLKFDARPEASQVAAGEAWRARLHRPVVLLASTREGEERLLLAEPAPAGVLVVVVPRHPQRFEEVAALADSRRTRQPLPGAGEKVHLGDTMGEMAFYYGACDVAVIGGAFAPLGGQNLIEALACGAPVVLGPHMFNFTEATRLALEAGAALQAGDASSAMRAAFALLGDAARRQEMSAAGRKLCETHRGATAHHVAVCRRLLKKGSEQFS